MNRRMASVMVALVLMSAAYAADIGVSPPRINVTIPVGGSVTTSFDVFWTGKEAVRLNLTTADWTMAQDGQVDFLAAGRGPYSAAGWLHLASDGIDLKGAGQKSVRVVIKVPEDRSLEGTYNAVLFAESPPSPVNGSGTRLSMRQRVGVVVYVTIAGTEKNGAKLADMYTGGGKIHAIVSNVGNTIMRYSGSVEVRDASGTTIKSLSVGDSAILRGTERDITVKMPDLPKGYYVLLLLLKDSRGGLLTGQLPYEVK